MHEPKTTEPLRVLVRKANCIPEGRNVAFFVPRGTGSFYPWGLVTVPASTVHALDGPLGDETAGKYATVLLNVNDRHLVETRDSGTGEAIDSEWMSAYQVLGSLLKAELGKALPATRVLDANAMFLKFRASGLSFEGYLARVRCGAIDLDGRPRVIIDKVSNGCGIA